MNICFVCETPFHILNAVNYIYHNKKENITFDVFVGDTFANGIHLVNALRKECIADIVYFYKITKINENKNQLMRCIFGCLEIGFPDIFIRWCITGKVQRRKYDKVFVPGTQPFSRVVINANPHAEICFYDDGLASYVGGFSIDWNSSTRRFLHRLFHRDIQRIKPQVMYLSNPQFYNSKDNCEIYALPKIDAHDDQLRDIFYRIFQYQRICVYEDNRMVYLDQPNDYHCDRRDEIRRQILNMMKSYQNDCVFRPHPRQFDVDYGDFLVDRTRTSWELICADMITGDHALISIDSTASVIPKMLFNTEPYVIFIYKLFQDTEGVNITDSDGIMERLKEIYHDKTKIIAVESLDEMITLLRKISRK